MKTPYYCLSPLFQIHPHPPYCQLPCYLQPPPPLFFLLSCFFSWVSHHIWCAILLNDINLHMSSLSTRRTLMCVLCNKTSSLLRSDTCSLGQMHLISHTQTHKHTQHTQGPVDWHTHINVYLHHLLFAHSSYLY